MRPFSASDPAAPEPCTSRLLASATIAMAHLPTLGRELCTDASKTRFMHERFWARDKPSGDDPGSGRRSATHPDTDIMGDTTRGQPDVPLSLPAYNSMGQLRADAWNSRPARFSPLEVWSTQDACLRSREAGSGIRSPVSLPRSRSRAPEPGPCPRGPGFLMVPGHRARDQAITLLDAVGVLTMKKTGVRAVSRGGRCRGRRTGWPGPEPATLLWPHVAI